MQQLTDEMVYSALKSNHALGMVVLFALLVIMVVMVLIRSGMKKALPMETDEKEKKQLQSNCIGLLIGIVIFAVLSVGIAALQYMGKQNEDRWHMENSYVKELYFEKEFDPDGAKAYRYRYWVEIDGFSRKVRIYKADYESLQEGEEVYVLVSGEEMPVCIWSKGMYKYTGNRLE